MSEPATIPQIDKIAAALAAAQGELTNPPKTKTATVKRSAEKGGGHSHSYRYADLAEIIEHVRPVLAKHKLAVVQLTLAEQRNLLVTRLIHESGQYLESTYPLPSGVIAQEMGSAITYARRYSLCAILGIAADEDDDGAKAGNTEEAHEKALRDDLIERMGRASLGNHAILTYTRANNLGDGSTVEDLPVATVQKLLDTWDDVVEAIRKAKAEKPATKTAAAKPEQVEKPADKPAPTALDGINKALAALMERDGITPDQLRAYYSGAGHFPATVEPSKLPESYIKALTTDVNWSKAVSKMKETK